MLEADGLRAEPRVFEVHPELAFGAMAGRVLLTGKRSWNGASERRDLLAAEGLELPSALGAAGAATKPPTPPSISSTGLLILFGSDFGVSKMDNTGNSTMK